MKITFVKYPIVITYAEDSAKYYIYFFCNTSGNIEIEHIYENLRQTQVLDQYFSEISLAADILHYDKYHNITK